MKNWTKKNMFQSSQKNFNSVNLLVVSNYVCSFISIPWCSLAIYLAGREGEEWIILMGGLCFFLYVERGRILITPWEISSHTTNDYGNSYQMEQSGSYVRHSVSWSLRRVGHWARYIMSTFLPNVHFLLACHCYHHNEPNGI